MVRDSRIQTYIFNAFAVTGSNFTQFSKEAVCGEIIKVQVNGVTSPGSLILGESGIGIEIWRNNAVASGTALQLEVYPIVYPVDRFNQITGSPYVSTQRVINNHFFLTGSGFISGTGTVFGPVTVFYR